MTKKDYVLLARVMNLNYPGNQPGADRYTWNNVYNTLADALERENPKFNRGKFCAACMGR